MTTSQKTLAIIVGSIIIVVGGLVWLVQRQNNVPGQYDKLAQCMSSKNVKFYGASWCPHCAEQKRLLGSSMKYVHYVECALPGNQQGQTEACTTAKIDTYPTWEFQDGSRVTGVQQPQDLATKTGCALQ